MKNATVEYVRNELPALRPDVQVVIRVYANVKGLGKTYRDSHVLDHPDSLESFVRGFNNGNPLCDFIDAGSGKECADYKLRGEYNASRRTLAYLTAFHSD